MEIGLIRQGDILLVPVQEQPPPGLKPVKESILATGEITGHAHRVRGTILDWQEGTSRFIQVLDRPGLLEHEDHDPIPAPVIAPNQTYRVIQQREWDLSGQWRKVQD